MAEREQTPESLLSSDLHVHTELAMVMYRISVLTAALGTNSFGMSPETGGPFSAPLRSSSQNKECPGPEVYIHPKHTPPTSSQQVPRTWLQVGIGYLARFVLLPAPNPVPFPNFSPGRLWRCRCARKRLLTGTGSGESGCEGGGSLPYSCCTSRRCRGQTSVLQLHSHAPYNSVYTHQVKQAASYILISTLLLLLPARIEK